MPNPKQNCIHAFDYTADPIYNIKYVTHLTMIFKAQKCYSNVDIKL